MKRRVGVIDALTGHIFMYRHLNRKTYNIKIQKVITPKMRCEVVGMGMPIPDTSKYGKLVFEFEIDYPKILQNISIREAAGMLPQKTDDQSETITIN